MLVTGGASGIGLASGRAFAHEGARLVIADIDGDGAREALRAGVQKHDVVCQADVARLFGEVDGGKTAGIRERE